MSTAIEPGAGLGTCDRLVLLHDLREFLVLWNAARSRFYRGNYTLCVVDYSMMMVARAGRISPTSGHGSIGMGRTHQAIVHRLIIRSRPAVFQFTLLSLIGLLERSDQLRRALLDRTH